VTLLEFGALVGRTGPYISIRVWSFLQIASGPCVSTRVWSSRRTYRTLKLSNMGCCQSKNDDAEQLLRIKELKEEIASSKARTKEQHDIIRFKIEVLVKMLATEEKKTATIQKRLETLRFLMTHQLDHDTLSNLMTQRTDVQLGGANPNQSLTASFELATCMRTSTQLATLQDESPVITAFVNLKKDYAAHKKAIFHCFADEEGSMESRLPLESFCKDLYTVLEFTKKPELQVAALRFSDADGLISIPAFIEFLATPSEVRNLVACIIVFECLYAVSSSSSIIDGCDSAGPLDASPSPPPPLMLLLLLLLLLLAVVSSSSSSIVG
jgi:hypothetical protein